MCDFASAGDVENLKLLLNNGVDPNQGDYDRRTPLHLACAEGNERVAELLVSFNADVNFRDRWEGTPLKDAIISGHPLVAESLKAKGARMPKGIGAQEMCTAASRGDVARMRMLLSCGVNLDEGDYDSRSPLHLASSRCPPPSSCPFLPSLHLDGSPGAVILAWAHAHCTLSLAPLPPGEGEATCSSVNTIRCMHYQ